MWTTETKSQEKLISSALAFDRLRGGASRPEPSSGSPCARACGSGTRFQAVRPPSLSTVLSAEEKPTVKISQVEYERPQQPTRTARGGSRARSPRRMVRHLRAADQARCGRTVHELRQRGCMRVHPVASSFGTHTTGDDARVHGRAVHGKRRDRKQAPPLQQPLRRGGGRVAALDTAPPSMWAGAGPRSAPPKKLE